jgi:hypothetical protein
MPSALPGQRGITPAFGYGAPHSSTGGTLTLLNNALLSAHYDPLLTSALRSNCLSTASVAKATQSRSPGVSSAAFHAQSPNLRFAPLMDTDFAVRCPLFRRLRLISGFCPSTRMFDPCFLQTPPRGGSPCIITRPSPPSGWPEDFHLQAAEHAQHTT